MDYFGSGKEVATVGVDLPSPADFSLIFVCLFFCLLLFLIHGLRQLVVGCCFLPLSSVYNTYIKGK